MNDSFKRILVTGGAGFLGTHLCERLLEAGHEVVCVDNFFTGTQPQRRAPAGRPGLRVPAPRRHLSALHRGRRDLQPRLPGVADPLPVRSGADDEDLGARRDQHARAGQAAARRRSCRRRPARSTATRRCIRSPRATGATSTRSARAPATTKASAAPRRCSSTTTGSCACASRSRASSTPTARACTRTTAAWCRTSSCRRLRGEPITHLRRRLADALVLLRRRPDRRPRPLMDTPDDFTGPVNLGNPVEFTIRELATR